MFVCYMMLRIMLLKCRKHKNGKSQDLSFILQMIFKNMLPNTYFWAFALRTWFKITIKLIFRFFQEFVQDTNVLTMFCSKMGNSLVSRMETFITFCTFVFLYLCLQRVFKITELLFVLAILFIFTVIIRWFLKIWSFKYLFKIPMSSPCFAAKWVIVL